MNNFGKGIRNISSNFLSQLLILSLGFIIPRLVIVQLGSEVNGLMSSINQVLAYATLLESGMSVASLQAMYAPISKGEHDAACDIMSETDRFFKRTGVLYLGIVLFITVLFPFIIESDLDKMTIMLTVLFTGLPGAISYYIQTKYAILLKAEGKQYIYTNVTTGVTLLVNAGKIALLINGFGIVAIQIMNFVFMMLKILLIRSYARKGNGWLRFDSKVNCGITKQSAYLLIHQISGLIFNNTDILILTYACGLKMVSVYSLYVMLFDIVKTVINNFNGIDFILGQSYQTDKKKFLVYLELYETWNLIITFALFTIASIFILPFIGVYTLGVVDINYSDNYLPMLLIATYLLSAGRNSSMTVITVAKHYKETGWHAIVEMVLNIVVSIVGVKIIGVYGVIFGTVAALLFRTNAMIIYANRVILHRSPRNTYLRWAKCTFTFLLVWRGFSLLFDKICMNTIIRIVLWAVPVSFVVIMIYVLVFYLTEKNTVKGMQTILMSRLKK